MLHPSAEHIHAFNTLEVGWTKPGDTCMNTSEDRILRVDQDKINSTEEMTEEETEDCSQKTIANKFAHLGRVHLTIAARLRSYVGQNVGRWATLRPWEEGDCPESVWSEAKHLSGYPALEPSTVALGAQASDNNITQDGIRYSRFKPEAGGLQMRLTNSTAGYQGTTVYLNCLRVVERTRTHTNEPVTYELEGEAYTYDGKTLAERAAWEESERERMFERTVEDLARGVGLN